MRYLLDTHALLWLRVDDPRLSREKWEAKLTSGENEVLVSVASLWEIALKRSLGKLTLEGSIAEFWDGLTEGHGFRILSIGAVHLDRLESLPLHHRDPFDRLIIAQAIEADAVCLTRDPAWSAYDVRTDW